MKDIKRRLSNIMDRLVPVAGTLMQIACSQTQEHTETCTCQLCRAFLSVHQCQNELQEIIKELK